MNGEMKMDRMVRGVFSDPNYLIYINLYMLFTGWEVRTGKIFCRGLINDPRPKVEGRF